MRAVTWQGKRNVSVETVPDPKIIELYLGTLAGSSEKN